MSETLKRPVNEWVIEPAHEARQHFYEVDGAKYPSVTTVLGVLDKPALVAWAAKMTAQKATELFARITDLNGNVSVPFSKAQEILEDAKKKFRDTSEEAADIGSQGHKLLEMHFLGEELPPIVTESLANGFSAFLQLKEQLNMKPVRVEAYLASKKRKVAGMADYIGYVDGKLVVADWKFSTGIYEEMKFQVSTYVVMAEEMTGKKFAGAYIFRFDKKTGEFSPKKDMLFIPRKECILRFRAFMGLLHYYYANQSLKES